MLQSFTIRWEFQKHPACFLTLQICTQHENFVFGWPMMGLYSLGKFHIHGGLNWGLQKGLNEVHLSQCQSKENVNNNYYYDSKPCHNRGIVVNAIHAVHLLATMKIQPRLVLDNDNLIGCEVVLMSHWPDRWYHIYILETLRTLDKLTPMVFNATIDFLS